MKIKISKFVKYRIQSKKLIWMVILFPISIFISTNPLNANRNPNLKIFNNENSNWLSKINYSYYGSIESGGISVDVKTKFNYLNKEPFTGSYIFAENGLLVEGKLEKCFSKFERYLSCTWNDKYGEGTVDFQFTEDLNSFAGSWSSSEYPNDKYPWDGYKNRLNQNPESKILNKEVSASEIIRLDTVCTTNYKNRFFYINGKKFDNRFIGDWKSSDTTAQFRICILNNNILFLSWSESTSFIVENITWTGEEINLTQVFPSTNWKTVSAINILSADSLKYAGTNPQGKHSIIFKRTKF